MSNLATAPEVPRAVADNADAPPPARAFTSVTLWHCAPYFLNVHRGYFDSWEDAEDFAGTCTRLEARAGAVFLVVDDRPVFVPDISLQVYRNFDGSSITGQALTVDDLLEEVRLEDMQLVAIGHADATRDLPIVARPMYHHELAIVSANDSI